MREAEGAFGDPTVFIEQAVVEPRHIEVQILADGAGQRHPPLRARLLGAAAAPEGRRDRPGARTSTRRSASACAPTPSASRPRSATATPAPWSSCSTPTGNYVFIEMNPRIQVEHTVTEEVTDVDLVQSQMRIASGETLADLGLSQDAIALRGAALQCRITTEDPANGFRPDTGRITTYRSPGGAGVRLDGGTTYTGAEVSAHFDSMLAKLTCRGRDFAVRRRPGPPRGRGVPDPGRVHEHPVPAGGARRPRLPRPGTSPPRSSRTHPQLLTARSSADRGTKLLTYLADVTVNQPHGEAPVSRRPGQQAAARRPRPCPPPTAPGRRCSRSAPRGSPARCASRQAVAVTDTTFRDAHQSLLATRVRTRDLLAVAGHVARTTPQLWIARGVGRRDVRRGAALPVRGPVGAARRAAPGGAEHLPADAAARAQHGRLHAVPHRGHRGLRARGRRDRHRRVPDLRRAQRRRADAAGDRGGAGHRDDGRGGRALLHRRPVRARTRGSTRSTTTCGLAERIVDAGAHVLAIKDMAGLLRAPGGADPGAGRCGSASTCPCTCTPTTPRAASSRRCSPRSTPAWTPSTPRPRSMAGTTSPAGAVGAGRDDRPHRPGDRAATWTRSATSSPTGRRPAGSTRRSSPGCPRRPAGSTPTRSPAASCPTCASRRSPSASARSSSRSRTCTPPRTGSSATSSRSRRPPRWSATSRCTWSRSAPTPPSSRRSPGRFDVPDSVIGFLSGDLGDPPGGWPEPFRTKALAGRTVKPVVGRARRGAARGPAARTGAAPSTGCCSRAPARSSRSHARSTATSRCCPPRTTSTASPPARSTRSSSRRASG